MSSIASHPVDARRRVCACLPFLLSFVLSAAHVHAATPAAMPAPAAAVEELTLERAIGAAISRSPLLRAFPIELRAHEARVVIAGFSPSLEISFELENVLGTGETRGLQGMDATLALSRVVELGGKRDARVAAAHAGVDALTADRQVAELDLLADVTRRFIDAAEAQARVELARAGEQLARAAVRASQRRVDAGKAPHAELDRAEIGLQRAQLDAARADRQRVTALRLLAATWGERDAVIDGVPFVRVRADLHALPDAGDFEVLRAAWANSPDALRFASAAQVRDAELRLAATQRSADVSFSFGVRRLEATDDAALVASVSMPLGAAERAEGAVAEARANRARVDVEREAAEARAIATLRALHSELVQAIAEATALRDAVLPRTQEALTETEYAYSRGRYSYLELVDAQREFLAIRTTLIEESAHAHRLRAEIERLVHAPLDAGNDTP